MEFFNELREVVRKVERGMEEVKEMASRTPADGDSDHHCLLLMLREKTNEMTNIKSEAYNLMTALRRNGFTEKVTACEALYEKNLEILEKTESYLKLYGYTPKPDKPAVSNTGHNDKEQQNDNPISDEKTDDSSADTGSCEEEVPINDPSTPVQFDQPKATATGTPKMADYGISAATMSMLSKAKDQENNSDSTLWSNYWPVKPEPNKRDESNHNDYPDNRQLISEQQAKCQQTSGNNTESPEPPVLCTPGAKQVRKAWNEQEPSRNESSSKMSTPEPPVFCTPGAKQLRKARNQDEPPRTALDSENVTPEPPILMTPGLPPLTGETERSVGVRSNTPVPPVLCMPGGKQIQQTPSNNRSDRLFEEPSLHHNDFNLDTPEPPLLTSDFGRLLNLGKYKDRTTSKSLSDTDNASGREDNARFQDRQKTGDGSPDSSFLQGRPILLQCDTPEAPELTFCYKGFLSNRTNITLAGQDPRPVSPQQSKAMTPLSPVTQPNSTDPLPTMSVLPGDAPKKLNTPPAPELTGKYSFLEDASKPKTSHPLAYGSIVNKENHVPAQTKVAVTQQLLPVVYIPRISDEEYQEQPSYLRTMLTQEKINQLIMQLNQMLADRVQAGEEAIVSQDDLQNCSDATQIQSVFLCLLSLKRLSRKYKDDGTFCYELC